MPGGGKLRFWKEKLDGYKKYHQIVKTIKMVTLAKYRQTIARTKTRDETLRYSRKILDVADEDESDLADKSNSLLFVPFTTNRGSCGNLNSQMFRYLEEVSSPKMEILAIGKKGMDTLPKLLPDNYKRTIINDMKQAMSFQFAAYVVDHMETFDWDRAQIIYSRFHQASVQRLAAFNIPKYETWRARVEEESAGDGKLEEDYLVQNLPLMTALGEKEDGTLEDFYKFHVALTILNAACENELSEYAARIIAVENQLANITGLMELADYTYNKTRKELITAELLEIIGTMTAMVSGESSGLKKEEFW
eukprot:TRINITY_DN6536_c0_g1_i1.p1 TRINITY_DN6536_c0_g1~~TRINITY_DN6536_c0_g1_i1.p1  ORF type:complete len:306 (+),score=80.44 TRINITY_DN6536_c0_g1_i1:56-973(+)